MQITLLYLLKSLTIFQVSPFIDTRNMGSFLPNHVMAPKECVFLLICSNLGQYWRAPIISELQTN